MLALVAVAFFAAGAFFVAAALVVFFGAAFFVVVDLGLATLASFSFCLIVSVCGVLG